MKRTGGGEGQVLAGTKQAWATSSFETGVPGFRFAQGGVHENVVFSGV